MTLPPLIRRLEAAQQGSRELDADIYRTTTKELTVSQAIDLARVDLGREPSDNIKDMFIDNERWRMENPPKYTSSLDIAVTLVPDGALWRIARLMNITDRTLERPKGEPEHAYYAGVGICPAPAKWHCTKSLGSPALALVIASLKATEQEK